MKRLDVRLKNSEDDIIMCDQWIEEGFYRIGISSYEDVEDRENLDSAIILSKSELEAFVKNILHELNKSSGVDYEN